MKKIINSLKGFRNLIFLDLEGTQFSHEMIQIGAVNCKLNSKGRIIKMQKPFSIYVRAKNPIGKIVTDLTGITEAKLKAEGVMFSTAIKSFHKYCGRVFMKSKFVTFGNNDVHIINQSVSYNLDAPTDITKVIVRNSIDFLSLIGEYIQDKNGQNLSLVNLCKLFGVKEAGKAHDASIDAINLANLYDAVLEKKDIVFEEYLKTLARGQHMPGPASETIKRLASGEDISAEEFKNIVRKAL